MEILPLSPRQERLLRLIETAVQQQGFVPSYRELARAMKVSDVRAIAEHIMALERKGYLRRVPGRKRALEILQPLLPVDGSIPILGKVAAGRPLLAVENQEGTLSLGPSLLGKGAHFALRVQGDSMIDAGIHDGDFVIVRQQDAAEIGEVVVALLGEEVTVKQLAQKGRLLVLEAANVAYAPIPLSQHLPAPRILGKVVGLYRTMKGKRRVGATK
ncbi:MAG: transcriptional repressor LexA [Candidatus Binatia bacterium]